MTERIALLRGINVGGNNPVPMRKLAALFTSLKFGNVQTYIASGNVFFEAPGTEEAKLRSHIEAAILKAFGFPVTVMLRTRAEMQAVVARHPFGDKLTDPQWKIYVVFLNDKPAAAAAKALLAFRTELEFFDIRGREVYAAVHKSHPKPAFSGNWVEKHLKIPGTARNWNTVNKLAE